VGQIIEAASDRLGSFGAMARFYYLRVPYKSGSGVKACCFMPVSKPSSSNTIIEEFAKNIEHSQMWRFRR
jgi:hypothetical protein